MPSVDEAQLERIAERRLQIKAKLKARQAGDSSLETDHVPTKMGMGEEQVHNSRKELIMLKEEADDAISHFRVKTDTEENERRVKDEALQDARAWKTEDEAASTNHRKGAIQLNFEALYQIKIPQDLMKEIEKQKDACRKVLEIKDKLTEEFRSQLRDKEEEYVRSLKDQTDDIDSLIEEMHARTNAMTTAYKRELLSIEAAYSQERRELLQKCNAEIEQLMKNRGDREIELKKMRDQAIAEGELVLDNKFLESAEAYNICKMVNQQNIHKIAQELEQYKAEYILNAERLNYNLQVLRERVKENKNAQNQHKRKLARLQDVLSQLISRYSETDKRFRQANNELTDSYRRVTEQYKDLQLKFQHFEKADTDKYQQIWAMHEKECMQLVHKALQGDRVVFEELAGVPWVCPNLNFWVQPNEENIAEALTVSGDEAEWEQEEPLEISGAAQTILQILYTQASFIIEERASEAIENLKNSTDTNIKIETILHTLGIQKTEQVDELLDYFTFESDKEETTTQIKPQDAVQALYTFLDERKKKSIPKLELSKTAQNSTTRYKRIRDKKKLEKEYWGRMADPIPESHQRLWRLMEHGLEKYLAQLQARSKLIDDADQIRKQNDELRALLTQYLGSKVNDELFSPPQLQIVQN
eukprot:Tbor_TRINITY_DN3381_c0_g1::TRINITY_DN3381_c0_g1_i1::g.23444::m.23444/K19754/DRC1; dynein regulatry complex protein 1